MTVLHSRHKTRRSRLARIAGAILAAFALALPGARAETAPAAPVAAGTIAYVQVSRANLRARAEANAPVLGTPVTNTRVKVLAETGEWCEVNVLPGVETAAPKSQKAQHGFIACRLLSAKLLTLAEVEAQIGKTTDPKELLNLYSRAFWIAPSLSRWTAVGYAIEKVIPDQDLSGDDFYRGPPPRREVPEFEAMKERLAAGILVKPDDYMPPQGTVADSPDKWPQYFAPSVKAALGRIKLPAIKPSFFNVHTVPIVIPGDKYYGFNDTFVALAMTDALSASNGAVFRAVATAPEHYGLNSGVPEFTTDSTWRFVNVAGAMGINMGIWNVGGLRITFESDAVLYGITAQGRATAMNIKEILLHIGADSACSYDHSRVELDTAEVTGYAPPSSAWLRWAGMPIPGGAKAKAQIKTRQFSGESENDLVVASEIDLNQDGVADFLVWQGRYQPQVSAEGIWEAVFANVEGQWRLLSYNEDADCT